MAVLGKILEGVVKVVDLAWTQNVSSQAFDDGKNGKEPRVIFGAERYKEAYDKNYARGQEASKTNLANVVSRKLENL